MSSESIKSDRIRSSRNAIRIRDDGHCILCDIHKRMSENDFFAAVAAAIVVVDDDGINDNQFVSKN